MENKIKEMKVFGLIIGILLGIIFINFVSINKHNFSSNIILGWC